MPNWAAQRQLFYAGIVLVAIAVVAVISWFSFFYRTPTCFDGVRNQEEEGVDCGGSCALMCEAPTVSALWARSVKVAAGVYHAVAMVRNPSTTAGTESLPYKFYLYDAENILVAERTGTMTLHPGEVVPLFEPNVVTGERVPARAFVEFGRAVWKKDERVPSPVVISAENLDAEALRLTAHVENVTARPIPKIVLTALLYGEDEVLVAASQTFITDMASRAEQDIAFTWQIPFEPTVVRAVVTSRTE